MFGLGLPELLGLMLVLVVLFLPLFGLTAKHGQIITATFWYAVVWGGLTILLPWVLSTEYPSLAAIIGVSASGAVVVALGFLVRRQSRAAAYGLIAITLLDMLYRLFALNGGGALLPLALFVLALRVAIYLNKLNKREREPRVPRARAAPHYWANWPVWMGAGTAFLQAGVTLLALLVATEQGGLLTAIGGLLTAIGGFNIYTLFDVVLMSAFAVAVLKRHLWAMYALVGYGLIDYAVKATRGYPWAAYLVLYVIAAWFLRKKPHLAPETIRVLRWRSIIKYAIVWWVGDQIVYLIFVSLGVRGDVAASLAARVWGIGLFGFQAWREHTWPFETVLVTSVAAFPLNILDALATHEGLTAALSFSLGTIAIAMLGVGCAYILPRRTVSACEVETK